MTAVRTLAARLLVALDRVLSALLMAASVTLLAAGLLWFGSPGATGSDLVYAPGRPAATSAPLDDPGTLPSSAPTSVPTTAAPVTATPTASLPAQPSSTAPATSVTPSGPATPEPSPGSAAVATRIVIPSLEIDLPVVSRDLAVPDQGPDQYPPCDVALYHPAFSQPGQTGTTYIYGHARDGMFLPLLTASERNDGASLVGSLVEVYTDDDHRYVYAITLVKRHATDFSIADDMAPGISKLVLQTSEGPRGTVPKLQVLAELQDVLAADDAAAHPRAKPRACYDTP